MITLLGLVSWGRANGVADLTSRGRHGGDVSLETYHGSTVAMIWQNNELEKNVLKEYKT